MQRLLLAAIAAVLPLAAQLPRFDAATIKPVEPGVRQAVGVHVYPGGRVQIGAVTLKTLVGIAFGLSPWQISAASDPTEDQQWNVEATPGAGTFNPAYSLFEIADAHLRQMLQSLLAERFQMKFHRETKTGTVYSLEPNGKPLKLLPPKDPGGRAGETGHRVGRGWMLINISMPQLAVFLSDHALHAPVVDRTGLTGSFDFESPTVQSEADFKLDVVDTFLPAVQEMGLQVKSGKGPVETLMIDHLEKPTSN